MSSEIRVATRGSALAMRQTEAIIALLRAQAPDLSFRVVRIMTHGDRFRDKPITAMGEQVERGIFNSALEEALLSGQADIATCSFKDVESELPTGLAAVPVGRREDARDVLVTRHGVGLADLPQGAVLATSSPRRTSQLSAFRPDFRFVPLRGNVPTRVERESRRHDGVILAAAGLIRLGLQDRISEFLSPDVLLPAPAQAAMGCEYLSGREDLARLVASIQEPETALCVRSEKALLVRLSGGCFAPIGVLARVEAGRMSLHCRIVSLDGRQKVDQHAEGPAEESAALVETLAERVAAEGGVEIVRATRAVLQPDASAASPG